MIKKFAAALLSLLITAHSAGFQCVEAVAASFSQRPSARVSLSRPAVKPAPAARTPAGLSASRIAGVPQTRAAAAASLPARTPFEKLAAGLRAHSPLSALSADSPDESRRRAGDDDFALRLGLLANSSEGVGAGEPAPQPTAAEALEGALMEARLSLKLDEPFDLLVLNPATEEFKDPGLYRKLSAGSARVEVLSGISPQEAFAAAGGKLGLGAAVMGGASGLMPREGTPEARRFEFSMKLLDRMLLMATGRLPADKTGIKPSSRAKPGAAPMSAVAARMGLPEELEKKIKQVWLQYAGARLKGLEVTGAVEGLYRSLRHKGAALLTFEAGDRGVEVWERLLSFWEDEGRGGFSVARHDLPDGRHVLVARKIENRVRLWLRPPPGFSIAKSVPNAQASASARKTARETLEASGFKDVLPRFDELGVKVKSVFGEDVGLQAVYVSVPRRSSGEVQKLAFGSSVRVSHAERRLAPLRADVRDIHGFEAAERAGLDGAGETAMIIDTSGKPESGAGVEGLVVTGDGHEDWEGHGTHVRGILSYLVPAAKVIAAKVFGSDVEGASDGDIMSAAAAAMQRGVSLINASLGMQGNMGTLISRFFSGLTRLKSSKGEPIVVVGSAGNPGFFGRNTSSPGNGRGVHSIAALTKNQDDGMPEISWFSAVGPAEDPGTRIPRLDIGIEYGMVGGDIGFKPGNPDPYADGVQSEKSPHEPAGISDSPDGKETRKSGTSMSAPAAAALELAVLQGLRREGAVEGFVKDNLPLVTGAIIMSTAEDLQSPPWFQGAGKAMADSAREMALAARKGGLDWIKSYKAVLDIEDKVYAGTEIPEEENPVLGAEGDSPRTKLSADERRAAKLAKEAAGNAAYTEAARKFSAARREAVPSLLEALKDPAWLVRRQAAFVLLNLKAASAGMALAEAGLADKDARVRAMAFLALAETPTRWGDELLRKGVNDERWDVGVYSAYALARHGDRSGVSRILREIKNPDKRARFTAVWLLGQLGGKATAFEAKVLAAKANDPAERPNIRHLAVAALNNLALTNPGAVGGKVVLQTVLAAAQDKALASTVADFMPAALGTPSIARKLGRQALRAAFVAFAIRYRSSLAQPGSLGPIVGALAQVLGIPLDLPTPLPDPGGFAVAGVDPVMGPLDLIVEVPEAAGKISGYWDAREGGIDAALGEAGLEAGFLARNEAALMAAMPVSRSLWLRVPEHKLLALAVELKKRGYKLRLARPHYALAGGKAASKTAATIKLGGDSPFADLPGGADLSLIRVEAGAGASEARALAALEFIRSRVSDPLQSPVLIALDFGSPASAKGPGALSRLIDALALQNVPVVAPVGNDGRGALGSSSPADAELAVSVGAVGKNSRRLQFYSSPNPTWTDLVDDLDPGVSAVAAAGAAALGAAPLFGTAAAAAASAEKLAVLVRRMTAALGRLPDGYVLYLVNVIKHTLVQMPENKPSEVGGGLFADSAKVEALLENLLSRPEEVARESGILMRMARRRQDPARAPPAAALRAPDPERERVELKLSKRVLTDGTDQPGGARIKPFVFKPRQGGEFSARSAGLSGFYFSKKELERDLGRLAVEAKDDPDHRFTRLDDYFDYLDALLAPVAGLRGLRVKLSAVRKSGHGAQAKDELLDKILVSAIKSLNRELRRHDKALQGRKVHTYEIFARAYNRLKPGKSFFDSLDEEELARIKNENPGVNEIWVMDIFPIGKINRWPGSDAAGSPYSTINTRVREELGGDEGYKRFKDRAHAAGLKVKADFIPNHRAIDSDMRMALPQGFIHMVPPQPEPGEDLEAYKARILRDVPREPEGNRAPAYYLVETERYPENGGLVRKWLLIHHPMADMKGFADMMWTDNLQIDFTRPESWDWLAKEMKHLVVELGVDSLRFDMAYEDLLSRFVPRWINILSRERDAASGWVREELDRRIEALKARAEALKGREFWEEFTDRIKLLRPDFFRLDEAYAFASDLSRTGSDAWYNKSDHDVKMGQFGLYDAQQSRDAGAIEKALWNVFFRRWQVGGAATQQFIGTHDGGEGNPYDKFGERVVRAVMATALLFRPILSYAGVELGVGQRFMLLGDLSASKDLDKAVPIDVKVYLNWLARNQRTKDFRERVLAWGDKHADLLDEGAGEVLSRQSGSKIAAFTVGREEAADGGPKVLLVAANFSEGRSQEVFKFRAPVLKEFGAFEPRADREYVLRDFADLGDDGQPRSYLRSGRELRDRGLFVELDGGGAHLFEVEELDPAAPPTGPPAPGLQIPREVGRGAIKIQSAGPLEPGGHEIVPSAQPQSAPTVSSQAKASRVASAWAAVRDNWSAKHWTEQLIAGSLAVFLFQQTPTIWKNLLNLAAGRPELLKNLPPEGYAGGVLANATLFGYFLFKQGREPDAAAVQAASVLMGSTVLIQIFLAGFMPPWAIAGVLGGVAAGAWLSYRKWSGKLGDGPWNLWSKTLFILGMSAVPHLLWDSAVRLFPKVLSASYLPALVSGGVGLTFMELDRRGMLPKALKGVWGLVSAWAATALFMNLPIPGLISNYLNPAGIGGLAAGTFLMGMAGTLLMLPRGKYAGDKILFTGALWGAVVGGWAPLYQVFSAGLAAKPFFWGATAFLLGYLAWLLRIRPAPAKK